MSGQQIIATVLLAVFIIGAIAFLRNPDDWREFWLLCSGIALFFVAGAILVLLIGVATGSLVIG